MSIIDRTLTRQKTQARKIVHRFSALHKSSISCQQYVKSRFRHFWTYKSTPRQRGPQNNRACDDMLWRDVPFGGGCHAYKYSSNLEGVQGVVENDHSKIWYIRAGNDLPARDAPFGNGLPRTSMFVKVGRYNRRRESPSMRLNCKCSDRSLRMRAHA